MEGFYVVAAFDAVVVFFGAVVDGEHAGYAFVEGVGGGFGGGDEGGRARVGFGFGCFFVFDAGAGGFLEVVVGAGGGCRVGIGFGV